MLNFLNKIIQTHLRLRIGKSKKGQAAVIIILITAVALIFYAASINFGRVSVVKTQTQISSAVGASQLVSQMASYGQSLFMEVLGGKRKVCDSTSVVVAILKIVLAIIILIIAIVLLVFTIGQSGWLLAATIGLIVGAVASVVGIVMGAIALYQQVTVIQPGITELWNKSLGESLDRGDFYLEQGISSGWGTIITDQKDVPDIIDSDSDGLFGFDSNGVAKDFVARPSVYYNMRVNSVDVKPVPEIDNFVRELTEFLYKDPFTVGNTWGLTDPLPCCDPLDPQCDPNHPCCQNPAPSQCNPCCVPESVNDPTDLDDTDNNGIDQIRIRPECCDSPETPDACGIALSSCGSASSCAVMSPYGAAYPFVYDSIFQNQENNNFASSNFFLSFLERLGHDDQHNAYEIPPPAGPGSYDPASAQQIVDAQGPNHWRLNDTTGFYHDPVWPYPEPRPPGDKQEGIFGFFYKIQDYGMDLNQLDKTAPVLWSGPSVVNWLQCYWYDWNWDQIYDPLNNCLGRITAMPWELRKQIDWPANGGVFTELPIQALNLPNDPGFVASTPGERYVELVFDRTWWVDGVRDNVCPGGACNPPLAADKIPAPTGVIAGEGECAQVGLEAAGLLGFWKKGDVQYCSPQWPYNSHCPQHLYDIDPAAAGCVEDQGSPTEQSIDCSCLDTAAGVDPTLFRDDVLDTMVHAFKDFIADAEHVLAMSPMQRKKSIDFWGPQMYEWLNPTDGFIAIFRTRVQEILRRLKDNWRDLSYQGATCEEVWCVPPAVDINGKDCDNSPYANVIPNREEATFDINANGIRGDMEDVIACLTWNAEELITYADGTTAVGNAEKFGNCRNTCSWDRCRPARLPRSLVPPTAFNRMLFTPADPDPAIAAALEPDIQAMLDCLAAIPIGNNVDCTSAELTTCQAMPQAKFGVSCQRYFTENPINFNADATDFDCGHRYFSDGLSAARATASGFCQGTEYFPNYWPSDINFSAPGAWSFADIGQAFISSAADPIAFPLISDCMLSCGGFPTTCDNAKCRLMPRFQNTFLAGPYGAELSNAVSWYNINFGNVTDPDPAIMQACLFTAMDITDTCRNFASTCQAMPQYLNEWNVGNQWYNEVKAALNWLCSISVPPRCAGDPDFDIITACDAACDATHTSLSGDPAPGATATCQAMPWFDLQCVADLYFSENPGEDLSPTGAPGNDIGFELHDCGAPGPTGNGQPWGPGNEWYDKVVGHSGVLPAIDDGAIMLANVMCDLRDADADPRTVSDNGWLLNVERSWLEAQNQVPKFKLRKEFLEGRLNEIDPIIALFEETLTQIDPLLDAAQDLADCYQNAESCIEKSGLPYTLIYGWQSDPPENRTEGYWHIVHVEGRLPTRCDGQCGVPDPSCTGLNCAAPDPPWPSVKTETYGFMNSTRCYELIDTEGLVKFRVTRWDEDRVSSLLSFPGGVPIWQFKLPGHPQRAPVKSAATLYANCTSQFYAPPAAITIPTAYQNSFGRAFMLNEFIQTDTANGIVGNESCWSNAVGLLSQGITSEVCAQYYYHEGMTKGMSFKFVPCPDKF